MFLPRTSQGRSDHDTVFACHHRRSRRAALVRALGVCPQTQTVPPVADVEFPAPTKDIWQASADGDIAELEANKHSGADLGGQMPGDAQVTALTVAVVTDQPGSVKWLLANGANMNAGNGDRSTALGAAAFLGRAEMAEILIGAGVDTCKPKAVMSPLSNSKMWELHR